MMLNAAYIAAATVTAEGREEVMPSHFIADVTPIRRLIL